MKRNFLKTRSWLHIAGVLIGLLPSCDYSYFEMDQLPDYTYQPVFAVPLVHSTLTISDMIPEEDDDLIEVGEDNLISLVYSDHLVSGNGGMFLQIPNAQFSANFAASPPGKNAAQSITRSFSYNTGHDDQLDSIVFKGGMLMAGVSAEGLAADGYQALITLTIPESYNQDGQPFSMTIEAGSSTQESLAGYTFQFYSSGSEFNRFDVHYEVVFTGSGNPNNAPYTFQVSQDFLDMQIQKIVGILATRILNLGGLGVNIGLFDSDMEGEVEFVDPKVRLHALNSFGFDIEVQANDLLLRYDDNEFTLTGYPNPWTIWGPDLSQMGQQAYSELILDKDNSNVVEGVAYQPETLYSSFTAQLNPDQVTAFVLDQSQLDVQVELELPLNGTASGFSLKDTLELSRNDSISEVEWIELAVDVINGLPAELFLQVEFADSLNQVNAILFEGMIDYKLIESAQTDSQGNVIASERTYTKIMLSEAQTLAFLNSEHLILSARVSTANQGENTVRIYDDQTLEVSIGARVKGKVVVEF
ncbi:MAG: hypothetical protein V2I46_10320 [Bacteroides sp.]|nr:hypothetical protein [Bacteroides sp.]